MLKKHKFILVFLFAVLLNIFVFFYFLPNSKNTDKFDLEITLKNIEQNLIDLNALLDKQNEILEHLQMQRAIDNLLLTIE